MTEERRTFRLGLVVLALLALLAMAAYQLLANRQERTSLLRRATIGAPIRIGYANEAPYGYLDSTTGRVTGEAPEIALAILSRMTDSPIEPVVTEFGSLIPGLKAGRFDIIAAGMYVTPERCQEIKFSNPTYAIGEAFLVRRGNPLHLHSFEDVAAHESARLGVVGGTVEHGYAKQLGVDEERIVVFPDNASAVAGVQTDRIDAFAATVLTVNNLLAKADSDQLERADPFHDPQIDGETVRGYGAFGFRHEDQAFVGEFNYHLQRFLGSDEHLELVRPFGFDEATLPGDMTSEQLCQSP